ncbi:MAG TPA: VOC family protein [Candidatus Methylomirabilis sp.]|nr:VOC family protein [Candidatus Methylomirabilis sp.]
MILADQIAYVSLVSHDPAVAASVFERHFRLPRRELSSAAGPVPVFAVGRSALAVVPPGHPLVEGETRPGVHSIALGVDDLTSAVERAAAAGVPAADAAPVPGLDGRRIRRLARDRTVGVRTVLTERLELAPHTEGPVERIDHIGVASADVREDEDVFCGRLGFEIESRQTDMEVSIAVESFTSDRYGVVYHSREPQPVGGLKIAFVTIGDLELEFLANFDPRQKGEVHHGVAGTTRQDQGAIARFVASHDRGLHHVALKSPDIDMLLGSMAATGLPMIDTRGRPGSRRALIGFPHPRALGGILMHLVQRPG